MAKDIQSRMRKAYDALDRAGKEMRRVTEECYPIGKAVAVNLGRARVVGRITGYGPSWILDNADEVIIENVVTRKTRRFCATDRHGRYQPELLQT